MDWDALFTTMRTVRPRRIGRPEAERLLAGQPADPDHPGLSRLLAAAAAPARPEELAGDKAILAEFAQSHGPSKAAAIPARRRDAAVYRIGRTTVKVAAGVLLATGGTAFAAQTGALPGPVQQHAHDMFSAFGVPVPKSSSAQPSSSAGTSKSRTTPTSAPDVRTLTASGASALDLCKAWDAAQKDPHAKAVAAEQLRVLLAAAGDDRGVPAFCAKVLGRTGADAPATATPVPNGETPTPDHPGNGNGNGNGSGNGNGNLKDKNKNNGQPSPGPPR